VIVGAEAFSGTEISGLSRRGQATGRLSVDVDVDLPVDQLCSPSVTKPGYEHTATSLLLSDQALKASITASRSFLMSCQSCDAINFRSCRAASDFRRNSTFRPSFFPISP
jgi:hypothetical protein